MAGRAKLSAPDLLAAPKPASGVSSAEHETNCANGKRTDCSAAFVTVAVARAVAAVVTTASSTTQTSVEVVNENKMATAMVMTMMNKKQTKRRRSRRRRGGSRRRCKTTEIVAARVLGRFAGRCETRFCWLGAGSHQTR